MQVWLWVGFLGFVIAMLALDLGVFHRRPHEISVREAFAWTGVWVAMAGLFNLCVYFLYEHHILGIGERIGHDISGKQAADAVTVKLAPCGQAVTRFVNRAGKPLTNRRPMMFQLVVTPGYLASGDAIGRGSPPEAYHALRIECKKLRYALEFVGPIYGKQATSFAARLTGIGRKSVITVM